MKHETIWKILTDIREDYIDEAAPDRAVTTSAATPVASPIRRQKSVQTRIIGWGALAACLAIVAGIAYPQISKLLGFTTDDAYGHYETRPYRDFVVTYEASWRIFGFDFPTEEDPLFVLEFPPIEWNGTTYYLSQDSKFYIKVPTDKIGDVLYKTEVTAHGISEHEKNATISATLSEYPGIDPAYGVVLTMEGVEGAFLYRTSKYADSFEELKEKTGLQDYLTTYEHIIHTTKNSKGEEVKLAFEGMTPEILWNELLSHGKTVDYDGESGEFLQIGIGHEILQYPSTLCVTSDGYITFSMLKAGKAVYVGEERARAFLDYLEENLTGYRLVEEEYSAPEDEFGTVTVTSKAHLNRNVD